MKRPRPTRASRRDQREHRDQLLDFDFNETRPLKRETKPLRPMNENQHLYIGSINTQTITFGLGPAGTGKTYIATRRAAELLRDGEIERLIVTRPAVEAGESIGFLPGEMEEKFDPYFAPVRQVLEEVLGKGHVEGLMKAERIIAQPLGFLRGHTFKDAFVILDEAQNTTPKQMKLFLTRIGEGTRVVVNGDKRQCDIPGPSGLVDAVKRLDRIKGVSTITFTRDDIVRSGIVRAIVDAYEGDEDDRDDDSFSEDRVPSFLLPK